MYQTDIKEISFIESLQSFRTPLLDSIFQTINVFDNIWLYFIFIIMVWYIKNEKAGFHLLYLQVVDTIIYSELKLLFKLPRPYFIEPSLKILGTTGYGFPSGAASAVMTSLGFIFFILKPNRLILKVFAVIVMLLVGLTRIYLGAHFPLDVIGGYLIGALILACYYYSVDAIEKWMNDKPLLYQLAVHCALILMLFFIHPQLVSFISILFGAVVWHIFFAQTNHYKMHILEKITAICLALGGSYILLMAATTSKNYEPKMIEPIINNTLYFLIGIWIGASGRIVSYMYKR